MASRGEETARRGRGHARRLAVAAGLVLLAMLLIAASPFFLIRVHAVRDPLLAFVQKRAGLGPDVRLKVEGVPRLDPFGVALRGVTLEARAAGEPWERVTHIGLLGARWRLAELIAGRIAITAVEADTLEVSLPALSAYALRQSAQPRRAPGPLRRSWARLVPPVRIARTTFSEVRLLDRAGSLLTGRVQLTGLISSERGLGATLTQGSIAYPRGGLAIDLRDGRIRAAPEGTLELAGLRWQSGASRGTLDIGFEPQTPASPLRARLGLDRLALADAARWVPPAFPLQPGDTLAGVITLRRGAAGVAGEARLRGRIAGEALEELRLLGAVGTDTLRLSELRLTAPAVALRGHGLFLRSQRSGTIALEWSRLDPHSAWLPWLRELPLGPGSEGSAQATIVLPAVDPPPAIQGWIEMHRVAWDGLNASRVRLQGRVEPGQFVRADSLIVELARGRVTGHGFWPLGPGEADFTARFDSLDLATLPASWRRGATGLARGELTAHGPLRDLTFAGTVEGRGLGWRGWSAERLSADSLIVRPRVLEGGGRVHVEGLRRPGDASAMDLLARAERTGGVVRGEARLVHPRFEIEVAGEGDPRGRAELRTARFWERRLGHVTLEAPWRVRWNADSLAADTLRLAAAEAHLALAFGWDRRRGGVEGELRASPLLLNRVSEWLGSADTLRGSCDLRATVSGRLPDPEVTLRLGCDRFGSGALDLGVPSVQAAWRDSALHLGPVVLEGKSHRVSISDLTIDAHRTLLSLLRAEPGGGLASLADLPCTGRFEIERLELSELTGLADQLGLPGGGSVPGTQSQLLVGGEAIPLRVIVPWEPETGAGRGLSGSLRAAMALSGTLRRPVLRLDGTLRDLGVAGALIGDLGFAASYSDSLAQVDHLELVHEGQTSWARGHYPFALSLLPPAARRAGGEVHLQAELNDLNLALVSALTRYVPDASGRLGGSLVLQGTGLAPRLSGNLTLRDGGFRIPSRSERISGAQAQLEIGPEGLRIRSLDARTGPRGTVTAVGTLKSPTEFELSAHVENARIFEPDRYDGLASGDLNAFTAPDPVTGRPVPHLNGVATVLMATITQDLARKELATPGPVIPWVIDLDVSIPSNVRVSQVNATADLGEGQLHVSYRWPYWNYSGSIKVEGGTYRLLNNAFTVTDGSVEFRDTGAGPDLTVSADAVTTVAVASEPGGPSETVTVTVHVQGKPEALQVSLSSQPSLAQDDLVELLSVGRLTRSGAGFQPGAQTQWILLNTMVDRVENSLLQQNAIFNRIALEPGTTGEEPLKMTLRPIVTPAFLVDYSQDLSLDPARELSVNYRLSRFLFLRAGIARDRLTAGGFNEEYSLDLKCRFEYP
jgi:hypothetical protein